MVLAETMRQLKFDFCGYWIRGQSTAGEWTTTTRDTFPSIWIKSYLDSIEINADPIFAEATNTCMPVKWSRRHIRKRRLIYLAAMRAGIRHGVTLSFRGPKSTLSILSVARRKGCISDEETISLVMTALPILAMAHDIFVGQLNPNVPLHDNTKLTNREKQVLIHASLGQTSVEIARKLSVTKRTVNFHFDNVLRKLDAKSRTHAIARANAIGIISC
jgi:LuxR family transcriptional regulator